MVTVAGGELDVNERVDALQSIEGRSRGRAFAGDPSKVHLYGVTISVEGQELLDAAELKLDTGAKYGLIGRNGVGASAALGGGLRWVAGCRAADGLVAALRQARLPCSAAWRGTPSPASPPGCASST